MTALYLIAEDSKGADLAIRYISELSEADRKNLKARDVTMVLARAHESKQNYYAASILYQALVSADASDTQARLGLAFCLERRGLDKEADLHYRTCVAIDSSFQDAHYYYALFLKSRGRLEDALHQTRYLVHAEPDDGVRKTKHIDLYFKTLESLEDYESICASAEKLLKEYPSAIFLLQWKATALIEQAKFAEAKAVVFEVLELDPQNRAAQMQLRQVLRQLGMREV